MNTIDAIIARDDGCVTALRLAELIRQDKRVQQQPKLLLCATNAHVTEWELKHVHGSTMRCHTV
jgi:hypothetical protein